MTQYFFRAWLGTIVLFVARLVHAGSFVNLGPQVSATAIQGSEFLHDPSGKECVYTSERGQPGHLLGYEVDSGKRVLDAPMGSNDGAWEVATSSDGWLYATGGNGHLFRYKPGERTVEDLGHALGQKVIWDVTPGKDGEVFVGTYPDCLVVRYSPKDGFTDVGRGAMVQGENYVRSLVYDQANEKVYAGIGSHAHLIELDPKTGRKKELLAKETAGQEAVYSLQIIPDEKSGDRLLAWVTNRNRTLVYNLRTQKVERELASADVKAAKKSPDGQTVYYYDGTKLMSFDLDRPGDAPRPLIKCGGILASQWVDPEHLNLLTRSGQVLDYDVRANKTSAKKLKLPPLPIPIQSIALGPDGKIWMGGFLAGGTAAFEPATGKSVEYRGMSQIERIGVLDNEMYFGVYPHGRFYRFDPGKPWGANNPRKFGQIAGQSRPMAMLGVPELQKVYIGMVPEYGFLGGYLISYDPKGERVRDFGEVVKRQSIVSLAYADGMIIGGTSISGGLGIQPAEGDAKLFGWDPEAEKMTFEITPVRGAVAITCLINGPDGNVWGVADGMLFIFDPGKEKVIATHRLVDVHYDSKWVWRDAFLVVHPSGQVYGVIDGEFFRLDPKSMQVTVLRDKGASLLAMDRTGKLYFKDSVNLWQYRP